MQRPNPLLETVNLAQPLPALELALRAWAGLKNDSVDLAAQLEALGFGGSRGGEADTFASELRIAAGALHAIRRSPEKGFGAYAEFWHRSLEETKRDPDTDLGRLRRMRSKWGGILLDSWTSPYVLILPMPSGHWVLAGWVSLVLTDTCPLTRKPGASMPVIAACAADPKTADAVLSAGMRSFANVEG